MFNLNNLYRWCDGYGGGLVIADSFDDATNKLAKMLAEDRPMEDVIIWHWTNDDYFDEENPDVLDIYM